MTTTNPFLIDIEDKDEYTIEDYIRIQRQLKCIDIEPILQDMYRSPDNDKFGLDNFRNRCTRGIRQTLCDVDAGLLPSTHLYTMGTGGDGKNCVVCCVPFSHERATDPQGQTRYRAAQQIRASLEATGYNGHFLLMNGGFPTPTGTEMKYVGVPYCFKIFLMLEAQKRGFDRVLWIDAGCYAINNPEPIFDALRDQHTLFRVLDNTNVHEFVFKDTMTLLDSLTIDSHMANILSINSIVFGLDMTYPLVKEFIAEYYDMVKLGTPFLSMFPEEMVFSAILNQPKYKPELVHDSYVTHKLQCHEHHITLERAQDCGYYFLHRSYEKYQFDSHSDSVPEST
jgi:hypothetical protein